MGAREIFVTTTTPFPDYVFDPAYKLSEIDSLEQFYKVNKHLQNIPSANDVNNTGGYDLGKLSTNILEKVEQATLYIIQLKEENATLSKDASELQTKN